MLAQTVDSKMKTIFLRVCLSLALSMVLCACPETTVPDGFGAAPVRLKPAEWEGTWSPVDEPEEKLSLKVLDAEQGVLELKEQGEAEPSETFTLTLRQSVDGKNQPQVCFAILKNAKNPAGGLHLLRVDGRGRSFLLWSINHQEVSAALRAGELKGKVTADKDGDHNQLAAEAANASALLAPRFWNWTNPSVMMRR